MFNYYNSITMHTKKFFISWLDVNSHMFCEEVIGLSGLIGQLWLIYEDKKAVFESIRINVIPLDL